MKKLLSVLLAAVLLLTGIPLTAAPVLAAETAAPAASEPEDLASIFQDNLDFLDQYYTLGAEFMIHKLCGILYPWEEAEANGYAPIPTPAAEFEAVLNRYFAPTEQQMADIRNYPIWDNDIGGTRPFYDADTGNYLVFFLGGFGGSMPEREYQRYIQTETGYTVFYQHVTYDVLEITESLYVELEALGWPATYTHNGYVYENGPDGYLRVASRDDYGYQYEVQYQDGFLRILSQTPYTAAPESDFEYEIEDGEATITGYVGSGGDVIIPSTLGGYPVTVIGEYAFEWCDSLTSVVIPDGVTIIGNSAFYICTSLTSVTIPDSVTSIGYYAFYECYNLTSVTIPDSVISIGERAFYGCTGLTSVTIPDSVTSIGYGAFHYCDSLTSVTIGDSVTNIGDEAFYRCTSLTSIDVAQNNPNYGSLDGVLFNKDKSTLIAYPGGKSGAYTIPDSVISIGERAFYGCTGLTSVTIPDSVISIGERAFYGCTGLTSVTIPDSVTSIGYCAFMVCGGLTSVTIPNSVISVDEGAFSCCTSLTSVTIPDSVITIGGCAFFCCTSLTAVTIPYSVASVGEEAFAYCSSLIDVYYVGSKTDCKKIAVGDYNDPLLDATWHYNYIPPCEKHTYKAATCTKPKTCKICGVTSGKKLGHTYENTCDKSCNRCKATRTIKHDYKAATCTKAKTCKVCGATSGKALGHKYTNSCDTSCNTCKATRKITHKYETVTKKATTTANGYTVKRCSVCKKETGKTTIYKANKVTLSKTTYTYNGKAQKPTVTVKDAKGNKIASSNYTVTYASGRKNVGTYKVTIKFKGKYSGTKTLTFKINPVKTTVSKLTAAKKSLKVTIAKKTTQVTGYEVQYSTNKNFTSAKTKTLTSYKKNTLTLSGLTAKKTYYVRVRTYKTVNGKKVYSAWSAVKSMKTK